MSKADILYDCLQSDEGTEEQRSQWLSEFYDLYEEMEAARDEAVKWIAQRAVREFLNSGAPVRDQSVTIGMAGLMDWLPGLPYGLYDFRAIGVRLSVESHRLTAWIDRDAMERDREVLPEDWVVEWGSYADPRQRFLFNHEGHEG